MSKFSQAEIAAADAELDEYPEEPFGDQFRWRCSMFGCMWWLHSLVDEVTGARKVSVVAPAVRARYRAQQAHAAELALGPPQQELFS